MWIKTGSVLMFIAVAMGAFGSHALKAKFNAYQMDIFKTAVLYHLIHALAVFAIGILYSQTNDPKINLSAVFITAGIFLFSGSLYLLAITQAKWLGAITPLGGLSFLIGWTLILFSRIPR